jgi:hypothetical protein
MPARERPDDCTCQNEIGQLPCPACFREDFEIAASKDPEAGQ